MMDFDEREYFSFLQENSKQVFLKMLAKYEKQIAPGLRARGYTRINEAERTVIFSFGEVTFSRSRWRKDNETIIPIDEKLGLYPRVKFSNEVIFQLTQLSNLLPYRKVAEVIELLNQVYITKNSVQTAISKAGQLLEEKEEYRILSLPDQKKIKTDKIYIEGDGLWIKQSSSESDSKSAELTHFVAHTGVKKGKRNTLTNKIEIVSTHHKKAKEQLLDSLYNQYEVTPETVIITNSDGGLGYSPGYFKELVSVFNHKEHFHFWDSFHVNQAIKINFRGLPSELSDLAFKAIKKRRKKSLEAILDTAESLIESESRLIAFQRFSRQLLKNFSFTAEPKSKGISSCGIGIMESQHRKISYRMKNRGMYWSKKGADTMSQTILLQHEGKLRDLFFGNWRNQYEKIRDEGLKNLGNHFKFSKKEYHLPEIRRQEKTTRAGRSFYD